MRKLIVVGLCAFILIAWHTESSAQTIGFKAGATLSKFDVDPDDPAEEQDLLRSFGGGGFVRFRFLDLALQVEALALTKGTQVSEGENEARVKLGYIEIPVTLLYTFTGGPYVFAGPTVAFETDCELEVEGSFGDFSVGCDEDEPSSDEGFLRKKTDVGAVVGAGFQFRAGPGNILIEGRYTWGVTNLNDDPESDTRIRNRAIGVFAGYSIPIK